jgi:GAF domain-containing protein
VTAELEDRGPLFSDLLARIKRIVAGQGPRDDQLKSICQLLQAEVAHYDWVGFYMADGLERNLLLGPHAGEPTQHVSIPFGQGVCGMVAEKKQTLVVPDVSEVSNYLSCSPKVRSEIVVPILRKGEFLGQLDIDSHTRAPFGPQDRIFLEDVCLTVAELF